MGEEACPPSDSFHREASPVTDCDSVLLVAFGGPEKPEDIRPFLQIVTAGRRIPSERFETVARHYEVIGGRSPLNEATRRQAEALRAPARICGPSPI